MVVLTNVGLDVSVIRKCVTCKTPRWRSEYRHYMSDKQCHECRSKLERVRCQHCGGPAGTTARHKPRKFCTAPQCTLARQTYAGRRANAHRSARVRSRTTKRCGVCHEVFPKTLEFFCAVVRDKTTGDVLRYHSYCRGCFNAERADRLKNDPVFREREYERSRRLHARRKMELMADPAAYEAFRKHERERQRRWRERREAATNDIQSRVQQNPSSGTGREMTVGPLMTTIDRWLQERDLTDEAGAKLLGMTDKRFREWRKNPNARTRMSLVDSALVGMDLLWFDVYDPAEYPEVAAIWEG